MGDFRTTIRIEDVEGDVRWSAELQGRAMPLRDNPPQFGVDAVGESTAYRGMADKRTEPLHLDYPDLVLGGLWRAMRFLTGDARILASTGGGAGDRPVTIRSPQDACDFFEDFAARAKVVEVTWTGGVLRRCRWKWFHYNPDREPDRRWEISFEVLGRGATRQAENVPNVESRTMLAGLRKAARDLDLAMATAFLGADQGFLGSLRKNLNNLRAKSASIRKSIADAGDLARAPATVLRDINTTVGDFRATYNSIQEQYDQTAYEYQATTHDSEAIAAARGFKTQVLAPLDATWDILLPLFQELERRVGGGRAIRYIPCVAGQSLVRIATQQLGSADLWIEIADLNGIVGQIVPPGVARLAIPDLSR